MFSRPHRALGICWRRKEMRVPLDHRDRSVQLDKMVRLALQGPKVKRAPKDRRVPLVL